MKFITKTLLLTTAVLAQYYQYHTLTVTKTVTKCLGSIPSLTIHHPTTTFLASSFCSAGSCSSGQQCYLGSCYYSACFDCSGTCVSGVCVLAIQVIFIILFIGVGHSDSDYNRIRNHNRYNFHNFHLSDYRRHHLYRNSYFGCYCY